MAKIKQPKLISADMTRVQPIPTSALSINFSTRSTSTATLTPLPGITLTMHAFIRLYTQKGFAGVFRVTGEGRDVCGQTPYTLRHAIDTLSDNVYDVQTEYSGTVAEFLGGILGKQKTVYWQLGSVDGGERVYKTKINYNRLNDLVNALIEALHDSYLTFDFTTSPWTVSLKYMPTDVEAEFRCTRNTYSASITRNDSEQATKLYLAITSKDENSSVGKKKTEVRTYTNEEGVGKYGIIEKTATVDLSEVADPDAWAAEFLRRRMEPNTQITIEAAEIYTQTGVQWDEFSRGKMARIILPETKEILIERVEGVNYPDVFGNPEQVTVELANKQKKFTSSIATLENAVRGVGGGVRALEAESVDPNLIEQWAAVVQHVVEAQDATGITTLFETGIILDPISGAKIYSLEQGFNSLNAAIGVNANAITLRVQKNQIISEINQTAETVRISADKIDLQGYVTASQFEAEIADINYQNSQAIETLLITAANTSFAQLNADSFTYGGTLVSKIGLTMGSVESGTILGVAATTGGSIDLEHSHKVSVAEDGTVTLGEVSTTGGNFNVADTKIYKDAVSAAASVVSLSGGGWINGKYIVTASNGKTLTVSLPSFYSGGGTVFDSKYKTTVYFYTQSASGALDSHVVDASSVYEDGYADGWAAARAEVRQTYNAASDQVWIYGPGPNIDTAARFYTIALTNAITSHNNSAPSRITATAEAKMAVNGTNRITKTATSTITINSGMLG